MTGRSIIPFRALVLWTFLVPTAGAAGIVAATWVLPLTLALGHGGVEGLRHIPVDWYGAAHAPAWVDQDSGLLSRHHVDTFGLFLSIPSAAVFSVLFHRLWTFIVVKRLHWMTAEEVERFNNKQQYL